MKKKRKYLHNLVSVDINRLVNHDGSFELQIGSHTVFLVPETFGKQAFIAMFIDHCRQPMSWPLSEMRHEGVLRNGGRIPYHKETRFFVLGSDGRRYAHLFIDEENYKIGTRRDFFGNDWNAYPRRRQDMSLHDQAIALERELFETKEPFMREHERRLKRSRLGI